MDVVIKPHCTTIKYITRRMNFLRHLVWSCLKKFNFVDTWAQSNVAAAFIFVLRNGVGQLECDLIEIVKI